jgi:alkaline phosphatase D
MNKSYAPFKIVALGGQFLSDNAKHENMAHYPERQAIIDRISEERIHGVVFLTGDRHCTELSRLELDRGLVIHDLTISPLTSSSYNNTDEVNTLRVDGTVAAERNYAELNFSGPRKDRLLEIVINNTEGEELWSVSLRAKDL